jgi:hypothetical protein
MTSISWPSRIWYWPAVVAEERIAVPGEELRGLVWRYLWKLGAATARIQV